MITTEEKRMAYCISMLWEEFDCKDIDAALAVIKKAKELRFNAVADAMKAQLIEDAGENSQLVHHTKKLIEAMEMEEANELEALTSEVLNRFDKTQTA